jgi:hypothetical protein
MALDLLRELTHHLLSTLPHWPFVYEATEGISATLKQQAFSKVVLQRGGEVEGARGGW